MSSIRSQRKNKSVEISKNQMPLDSSTQAKKRKFENRRENQEEQQPGTSRQEMSSSDHTDSMNREEQNCQGDVAIRYRGENNWLVMVEVSTDSERKALVENILEWKKEWNRKTAVHHNQKLGNIESVKKAQRGLADQKGIVEDVNDENRVNENIDEEENNEELVDQDEVGPTQTDVAHQNLVAQDVDGEEDLFDQVINEDINDNMIHQDEVDELNVAEEMNDEDQIEEDEEQEVDEVSNEDEEIEIASVCSTSTALSENEVQKDFVLNIPYEFKLSKQHHEALRANENGSFELSRRIPGIPWKKFGKKDLDKFGHNADYWPVQAVYRMMNKYFVYYEGWTVETGKWMSKAELDADLSEMLSLWETRLRIIRAIEKITNETYLPNFAKLKKDPKSSFWILEDLTYFHSLYHAKHNLAPLFYMSKFEEINNYPEYICLRRNLIDTDIANDLKAHRFSKHINELVRKRRMKGSFDIGKKASNPCTSSLCKCDAKERLINERISGMRTATRLEYGKDGRLNFDNWDGEQRKYLIECSDACGCDTNCPTRRVQRGQTIPLVISYEGKMKGYGVRAGADIKKGDFIAEYLGIVRRSDDEKDELYSIECHNYQSNIFIDSLEKGNVTRFLNHACVANAVFVEASTRVSEKSTLVPRVGVYALKDIEMGEEITAKYYSDIVLKKAAEEKEIACRCRVEGCLGWLPMAS